MDRSQKIPLKDYERGEEYTKEEIAFLKARWSEEDIDAVATWIDGGARKGGRPKCVEVVGEVNTNGMEERVYDMRGIDLSWRLTRERTGGDPEIALRFAHLEHANLREAHLEHAHLREARLEHALLAGAHLEHAHLSFAHLEHARLSEAHLDDADLGWAKLEQADLSLAHLDDADLGWANLEQADLSLAHLDDANVCNAHLENADLTRADIRGTDFSGVFVDDTLFRGVVWRPESVRQEAAASLLDPIVRRVTSGAPWWEGWMRRSDFVRRCMHMRPRRIVRAAGRLAKVVARPVEAMMRRRSRKPDGRLFEGFDVRGIRYSDPLFDQFVRQSEFIRGCSETWPRWLFWLWKKTCNCGRSIGSWLVTCAIIIVLFGGLFAASQSWKTPLVRPDKEREATETGYTPFYFSIVTFSTLGFGDVTPCRLAGELLVTFEVFLGYVMLGGLITILATKFVPPR